jgi:hypothetical protein
VWLHLLFLANCRWTFLDRTCRNGNSNKSKNGIELV